MLEIDPDLLMVLSQYGTRSTVCRGFRTLRSALRSQRATRVNACRSRQMFRKVGAPEFRKEGEREKKEKIDESKKKTSTTPVESRSSYNTGIGDRRSIFYRRSRIYGA